MTSVAGAAAAAGESNLNGLLVGMTTTDSNGVFTFHSLDEDASYDVTPVSVYYTFNPPVQSYADLDGSKFVTIGALVASYTITRPPSPTTPSARPRASSTTSAANSPARTSLARSTPTPSAAWSSSAPRGSAA